MFWGMMNDRCLCLGLPRSFDTDKDEHPVKFVIDNLKEGILETVYSWLSDIAGDDRSLQMPNPSQVPLREACLVQNVLFACRPWQLACLGTPNQAQLCWKRGRCRKIA